MNLSPTDSTHTATRLQLLRLGIIDSTGKTAHKWNNQEVDFIVDLGRQIQVEQDGHDGQARQMDADDSASSSSLELELVSLDSLSAPKFLEHYVVQWNERYCALQMYKEQHGNCLVPHKDGPHKELGVWVKRQRSMYRAKKEGMKSPMMDEREAALNRLGFVWNLHDTAWDDKLGQLGEYHAIHGNCNVPATDQNHDLAMWVKSQRRHFTLFQSNKRAYITPERIAQLNELGFAWSLLSQKARKMFQRILLDL